MRRRSVPPNTGADRAAKAVPRTPTHSGRPLWRPTPPMLLALGVAGMLATTAGCDAAGPAVSEISPDAHDVFEPADAPSSDAIESDGEITDDTCLAHARSADGSCCAADEWLEFSTGACIEAGPPTCSVAAALDGECRPFWCAKDGQECCPAGEFIEPGGDVCTPPIGAPANPLQTPAPPESVPAAESPVGVPPLDPYPSLFETRICHDPRSGGSHICPADSNPCDAGMAEESDGTCNGIGVSWECPAGHLVGASAQDGALPTCELEGRDCTRSAEIERRTIGPVSTEEELKSALKAADPGAIIELAPRAIQAHLVLDKDVELRGPCGGTASLVADSGAVAIRIEAGATVRLSGLVIDSTRSTPAIDVADGALVAEQCLIRGTVRVMGPGSDAALEGVVIEQNTGDSLQVSDGAHVSGQRCRMTGGASTGAVVTGPGSTMDLRDCLIDGGRAAEDFWATDIRAEGGASLSLVGCRLSDTDGNGIWAQGEQTTVTVDRCLFDSHGHQSVDGLTPFALRALDGAAATVSRSRFSEPEVGGTLATSDASVAVDSSVFDGGSTATGLWMAPAHVYAHDGGYAEVTRSRLHRSSGFGVAARGAGATAVVRECLIDETESYWYSGQSGRWGVMARSAGAHVVIEHSRVHRAAGAGVVSWSGALVTVRDSLISETLVPSDGNQSIGWGLYARINALVELERTRITGNVAMGIHLADGSTASVQDVVVDSTLPGQGVGEGIGVFVQQGSTLTGQGLRVAGSSAMGVFCRSSQLDLERVELFGTMPRSTTGSEGAGLVLRDGCDATISDLRIHANHQVGATAVGFGTSLEVEGFLVDGQLPAAGPTGLQQDGIGVWAKDGGDIRLRGGRITGNQTYAAVVQGAGSDLELVGVVIDQTRPGADGASGAGILAQGYDESDQPWSQTYLQVESSVVRGNRFAGLEVQNFAHATVENSVLTQTSGGVGDFADFADGIRIVTGKDIQIRNSILSNNSRAGMSASGLAALSVTGNVFAGNYWGLVLEDGTDAVLLSNAVVLNAQGVASSGRLDVGPPPAELLPPPDSLQ